MRKIIVFLSIIMGTCMYAQKEALPNVQLKNLEGKEINVADYNKKEEPIIISFWATWCGPCLKELGAIHEVYDDWREETGVELIAVSIDDAKTVKRVRSLVNGKSWEYEILYDDNHELKRAMNVINVPFTIIVYKGEVVYKHTSYTPGVERELFNKVKSLVSK